MKLKKYRVRNFRNILDSGDIDVDDNITCLVGKNESGKTALLKALFKTNPANPITDRFDSQVDYPKRKTKEADPESHNKEAVVECCYELQDADIKKVTEALGEGVLTGKYFGVKTYFNNKRKLSYDDLTDEQTVFDSLLDKAQLSDDTKEALKNTKSWEEFHHSLTEERSNTTKNRNVIRVVSQLKASSLENVLERILSPLIPHYFFLDEYPQLSGGENLNSLAPDKIRSSLSISLFEIAQLPYEKMIGVNSTRKLMNVCGGKGGICDINKTTSEKLFKYWSQNKKLRIIFCPMQGATDDPKEMRAGVNVWIKIYDKKTRETVSLEQRSRGFIWFLSMLVQYVKIKQTHENIIMLLDEPGLHLHGKAQYDLLQCFGKEFSDTQILYTTHSPFMVDISRFDRIRTVHDNGEDGAKVSNDVLSKKNDSLLPLQAALGYGVTQSLFMSPNCLIVEGVSDMIYLKTMYSKLKDKNLSALFHKWTIVPAGGIGKVHTFVAIVTSKENVNTVVLLDAQQERKQSIDNLHKQHLLEKDRVLTYTDFIDDCEEADIEDIFDRPFYLNLVNESRKQDGLPCLELSKIKREIPRITIAIRESLKQKYGEDGNYCHYKPAKIFHQHIDTLWDKVSDDTKGKFEKIFNKINQFLK